MKRYEVLQPLHAGMYRAAHTLNLCASLSVLFAMLICRMHSLCCDTSWNTLRRPARLSMTASRSINLLGDLGDVSGRRCRPALR